jgi:GDP-4-dehydro-6-deoxy-D-mannose reductase
MRVLVTGAAGFVGRWLTSALVARGDRVAGTTLDVPPETGVPGTEDVRNAISWHRVDLRDLSAIEAVVDEVRPDVIFHLAGVTFVPAATADPGQAFEVNTVGPVRLLGVVAQRKAAGTLDPLVLLVGSGEQYGRQDFEGPIPETAELRPLSVYGASKVAQEVAGLQAFRSGGVRVVCTRSFNHTGPGQPPHMLVPALVQRALTLRGQPKPTMPIGNVTPVRDFLHVRDVVDAYLSLADRGVPGQVYNVASGEGRSVGDLAKLVLARVGVTAVLEPVAAYMRPVDLPYLIGDPTRLRAATGWRPRSGLEHAIDELIDAASR